MGKKVQVVHNGLQTFCSNANFMEVRKSIETKVNTFLFMYMNSCDVIICYLELRKTQSVFPIPLEFEISKLACTLYHGFTYNMVYFYGPQRKHYNEVELY